MHTATTTAPAWTDDGISIPPPPPPKPDLAKAVRAAAAVEALHRLGRLWMFGVGR